MESRKLTYLFLLSIFLLARCETEEILDEYYLGDLVNTNPYTGNEDIVFLSSKGDTILLIGKGRTFSREEILLTTEPVTRMIYETDITNFIQEKGDFEFLIYLGTYTRYPLLGFRFSNFDIQDSVEYLSESRYKLPLTVANLEPEQWHYDSLFIHDKYYFKVFADSAELKGPYQRETNLSDAQPIIFYYSITDGLLKVDFDDDSNWEFLKTIP